MTGVGERRGARRALGWALLAGNVVMVLLFVGAAGATSQARRALEGASLSACGTAASTEAGVASLELPPDPADVEFVAEDTVRFEARDRDGLRYVVTCRFAEPDPDDDGGLPVRSVEVDR